jgi:putative transposase
MTGPPRRRSIRLRGYDYAGPGSLFFTFCTADRFNYFGSVENGEMSENEIGDLAWAEWHRTLDLRPEIDCHAFVVMPNHVHGLISLNPNSRSTPMPPIDQPDAPFFARKRPRSLSTMATGFKGAVTREMRQRTGDSHLEIWQRNYHERVVRDEREFDTILKYIEENPFWWDEDRFNPANDSRRN